MELHSNCTAHFDGFVELNEAWIKKYFVLEDADRKLAEDPSVIITTGGAIITAIESDIVVGACALMCHNEEYELARMAVDEQFRGRGIGRDLANAVIALAKGKGAHEITLLTNKILRPAVELYKGLGFKVVSEGKHPIYSRCNIVMRMQIDGAG